MNSFFKILEAKLFTNTIITKLWLVIAFTVIVYKGLIPGWQERVADFNNYYVPAQLVSKGQPIHQFYDNEWFKKEAQNLGISAGAKFSPFPPVTAYTFLPLTYFKPLTAKRIWLVINMLLLLFMLFRIKKLTNWSLPQAALFVSLFTFPIANCLNLGQLYLLIGFVLLEVFGAFYFQNKSQPKLLGFIIGITATLKYLPILFLGYILKHPKKHLILFCTLLTISIPNLFVHALDNQVYGNFFQHFLSHIQGRLPGQGEYAIAFQSIDSLLNNLFIYDSLKNPVPSINAPILKPIIKYSLLGIIGGLLLLMFKKNRYQITAEIVSIGIIGAFVMIPASTSYHFLLLLWPILQLVKWQISHKLHKTLIITAILIFLTLSVQQYQIPNFSQFPTLNLLLHYPRFWGILCVFLLFYLYYLKALNKYHG